MFADQAKIYVRSGKGGDGHVSFRREKYVTNGGPDGGDGGKGGDVWLEIDDGSNTLIDFRNVRKYCAQHGEDGGKRNCRGKDGESITLKVPEGTVVREAESGKVIVDMSGENRREIVLKGGRGGTGNMNFMINVALTVGTMDGANVEMYENVGENNIYIFGLRANEVEQLWKQGYDACAYYNNNPRIQRIIESMKRGYNGVSFDIFANYLTTNSPVADPYMCLADYYSYCETKARIDVDYLNKTKWAQMSLNNVATSGFFAADRAIREYADRIWDLKVVK